MAAGGEFRLASGGHVDRTRSIAFGWDGRRLTGYDGDTLASALLAHGVRVVGRSFKFHRPRGILSAGVEEPNALVTLGSGARIEPSARATLVRLHEGLEARPQNCWPSVDFDVGRVLDAFAPLWPAGFYNKTFKWPSWHAYEPLIRRAAGLGDAPTEPDPDRYEAVNASCDLLVVGGGCAGLHAALTAARAGANVLLVEQDAEFGGWLLADEVELDGLSGRDWAARAASELAALPNARVLARTTAFGLYDHGLAGLLERVNEAQPGAAIRHRYWRVRTRAILLASGALEQPFVFERNDLPGVMLAGSIQQYARRYAVAAGRRVAFATNNDRTYLSALAAVRAGVGVVALLDARAQPPAALAAALRGHGVAIHAGTVVTGASGSPALGAVRYASLAEPAREQTLACDALGISGGWAATVHLHSHARGKLAYDALRQCFLPVAGTAPLACAGGVAGAHTYAAALASAGEAVAAVLADLGRAPNAGRSSATSLPTVCEIDCSPEVGTVHRAPRGRERRQWIDFQHDVTLADVRLALDEGYDGIEHLKRYTTTGMSVDQGKTSNLNALLIAAELSGRAPQEVGTTTYRPPFMPVTLGAIAARGIGEFYAPSRRLPAHAEHEALGAHFEDAGGWQRPGWYARAGESMQDAIAREIHATRTAAGLFDASPLGKIELEGPDAAWFLDRFYPNNLVTLEIGRTRYGLMLNENGVVVDDGTIARLGPEHYLITTTSGGGARIAATLEEWRQCEWPDRRVLITPVTTQWATIGIAGPRAREILARLPGDIDLAAGAFPHLHVRCGTYAGVPARIYRVSFSGELGYEVNVPARYGAALWRALLAAGSDAGLTPYGLEALLVMRLEKGYLHVGSDTDGTTVPADVGYGEMAARKQADFIGKRSLSRSDLVRPDRLQLVGLEGGDRAVLVSGAHLRLPGTTVGSDGFVTSAAWSPTLGKPIALALLRGGRARLGERIAVHDLERTTEAVVVKTPFYDPEGARLHG